MIGLSCVRKLLWFRIVGLKIGYILGVSIGKAMYLVDSIDCDGLILKVSSKSDDFWSRSHGRNVEGLSVGEVVRQNWWERLRKSACESIGGFSR